MLKRNRTQCRHHLRSNRCPPPSRPLSYSCGMAITVTPTGATLGAYVTGVALRSIDDEQWGEVEKAWHEHGVLAFPGQHLTHDEQVAFSTRVGDQVGRELLAAYVADLKAKTDVKVNQTNLEKK